MCLCQCVIMERVLEEFFLDDGVGRTGNRLFSLGCGQHIEQFSLGNSCCVRCQETGFCLVLCDGQFSHVVHAVGSLDAVNRMLNAVEIDDGGFYRSFQDVIFCENRAFFINERSLRFFRVSFLVKGNDGNLCLAGILEPFGRFGVGADGACTGYKGY